MIGMMTAIVLLCTMLYWTAKPNYHRIDNDLKYRYIKMKGEATPDRIAELEEIFELNRDNGQNPLMDKARAYSDAAAVAVVQARLREREANRLNENASRLKNE